MHRERAHLKVAGFSIVLNALLTKKLPTFLSRLNEISGGCEKIAPVSGSFWSIFKLLRMIAFTGNLHCYRHICLFFHVYFTKFCNIISLLSVIVRVSIVLKRTLVDND